ncbi:MAG TPA: transcriptional regulator [Acidobacteriota bacterium]|nr:transcriptional regulator [Acidobacteriota bacterium]
MYQVLLKLLLILGIIWLIRRLLATFLSPKKQGQCGGTATAGTHMVKDPVCGMYMDSRLAIRHAGKGKEIYFCSEECRKKFLNESGGSGDDGEKPPPAD